MNQQAMVTDPSKVDPYDLYFESLDEVIAELPADWTSVVAAQAVAESLGYAWKWQTWSSEPQIEIRLGASRRKQRNRWWQIWREGFCTLKNHRDYSYVSVGEDYGDADSPWSRRPLCSDYEWR